MSSSDHPFARLTPDRILDAVEACGWPVDGRVLALNSYENRVFQVGLDEREPVIVKFYRPDRWSDAQILEEHALALELAEEELPVIPPMPDTSGATLMHAEGFRIAVFRRRGGHAPPLDDPSCLETLGRSLAQIHNVGAVRPFAVRPKLDLESFGRAPAAYLTEHAIPSGLRPAWSTLVEDVLSRVAATFARGLEPEWIRVHGDCHPGNVLWRDRAPHFVDLDDARMAPAVQDLWMLLSGDRQERRQQLGAVLDGYLQFRDFDFAELRLIEALRSLRMLHFAGWLAQRWSDPAFPSAFPWFGTEVYWGRLILQLREQLSALDEPPLVY